MSCLEFEKMLSGLLPSPGRMAVTLTDVPERDDLLARFLDAAIRLGQRQSSPLAEIHLPSARLAAVGNSFRNVPVEDGGDVLRLVFEN